MSTEFRGRSTPPKEAVPVAFLLGTLVVALIAIALSIAISAAPV